MGRPRATDGLTKSQRYYRKHAEARKAAARAAYSDGGYDRQLASRADNPRYVYGQKIKSKYGLSLDAYDDLVLMQEGRCGMCNVVMSPEPATRPCVDHDHATGLVRGLLCHNCNVLLGHAKDSVEILQAAVRWVSGTSVVRRFGHVQTAA